MGSEQGFPRLRPLLHKAGLPEEMHDEFVDGIASFTTMMTVLLRANEDVAENYLTFAMVTPEPDPEVFELTIKKADGKSPVQVIDEMRAALWDFVDVASSCGPVEAGSAAMGTTMPSA